MIVIDSITAYVFTLVVFGGLAFWQSQELIGNLYEFWCGRMIGSTKFMTATCVILLIANAIMTIVYIGVALVGVANLVKILMSLGGVL